MKKHLFFIFSTSALLLFNVSAQEFKVSKSNGKIILNLCSVSVEGYNGNEIIFSSKSTEAKTDSLAKGLQAINGSGFRDNTGLGISVTEKGNIVEVNQIIPDLAIKLLVPKNVIVSFICHKMYKAGMVTCKNLENEIEIEVDDNNVLLENITGPVTVRSLYGSIVATFTEQIRGPISIASIHSTVDVAIPVDTKANINLKSSQSLILASPDFKIAMGKSQDYNPGYGSLVYGKLNGGGFEITLYSEFSKVYLRKKE